MDNFPYPVVFVPIFGSSYEGFGSDPMGNEGILDPKMGGIEVGLGREYGRVENVSRQKSFEIMKNLGYKEKDFQKITPETFLILFTVETVMNPEFLGTPWMVMHAIADSGEDQGENWFRSGKYSLADIEDIPFMMNNSWDIEWSECLTVKSARDGLLGSPGDAIAEMFCQEVLTTKGFRWNQQGAIKQGFTYDIMNQISLIVKDVANNFKNSMRGKNLIVAVT